MQNFRLSPSVGVARLGNAPGQFYLAPTEIGGLPQEADRFGNAKGPVGNFKDTKGRVRRQGQPFRIYCEDKGKQRELTLDSPEIAQIRWIAHLANKKAAWYQYQELEGNLLYGARNSYTVRKVPLRNKKAKSRKSRQALIVDPGPRELAGTHQKAEFDEKSMPAGYPGHFPTSQVDHGTAVTSLGSLVTDDEGRLVVLGGYGHAGGNEPLTSYGGSDTWHDDVSDGPVYCTIEFTEESKLKAITLQAWCIVGSPDYAPEIVNISNLSDTMFDVGVRAFGLVPKMCRNGKWNKSFKANYWRDIAPIFERMGVYQWVANVQPMMSFANEDGTLSDPGKANRANRQNVYEYFRALNDNLKPGSNPPQQTLMRSQGDSILPMLPLNSGSNSVSNANIVKFLALNETQYFLLGQWADGKFDNNPDFDPYPVPADDEASVGNCVGLPMCPGIEVTWSVQNPAIYAAPYVIADHKGEGGYEQTGLDPNRDECEGGGCEPGDLTKRMACPWQADFFQCTVQPVNFTNPRANKKGTTPLPPTYYAYWWPPQAPWDVIIGEETAAGQAAGHLPMGEQANYARGINSFVQMVEYWYALAFIRNRNPADPRHGFFTETERNHALFSFKEVPVGQISGNSEDDEVTIPVFFIEQNKKKIRKLSSAASRMVDYLEERAFKPVSTRRLPPPRSGMRRRR